MPDPCTLFIIGASIITGLLLIAGVLLTLGLRAERKQPDIFHTTKDV